MPRSKSKYSVIIQSFGRAVRQHRSLKGFSQESLAEKAALDRSYMSQIERGIKNATLLSLCRIAEALEVSPSSLLAASEHIAEHELSSTIFLSKGGNEQDLATSSKPQDLHLSSTAIALVVDDEEEMCRMVQDLLLKAGLESKVAFNGMDAMRLLAQNHVGLIVSDIRMNQGNGLDLLASVRRHYPQIPFFFITGYEDLTHEEALNLGARGLFCKPFDMPAFVSTIKAATGFEKLIPS